MKKKKWKLSINGIEPVLETYKTSLYKTEYKKIYMFQLFRKFRRWLYSRKIKKHFNKIGLKIMKCEGCGDGIAEWAIKEPNNQKYVLFVCNFCVGFYDIYITRRRLELQYLIDDIKRRQY